MSITETAKTESAGPAGGRIDFRFAGRYIYPRIVQCSQLRSRRRRRSEIRENGSVKASREPRTLESRRGVPIEVPVYEALSY
jgi:hypothetical protein